MLRWLGLVLAIGLASAPAANAQVFKPKAKKATPDKTEKADKSEKADKGDAPKKASASAEKKSAKKSASKKKVAGKSKKKAGSETAAKDTDKDFVEITDDDDIE